MKKLLTLLIIICCASPVLATNNKQRLKHVAKDIKKTLQKITPDQESVLQSRINHSKAIARNPFGILFFHPNYFLPYYYTGSPYQAVYAGHTPNNQSIMKTEFKAQLSIQIPIWQDIANSNVSLYAAYTQLSYWQFYAKSQYFRETNYMPEIFLSDNFLPNWALDVGAVHQSNGRGGSLERSWNRTYLNLQFSNGNWLVSIKPWLLIYKNESSDLHNPDIAKFLGHERLLFAYSLPKHIVISLTLQNIEHGFSKMSTTGDLSFPLTHNLDGYIQVFHGYGQSLIEYDHKTNSIGVGIALSNWIK